MADVVHIRDRLDRLPRRPRKTPENAQILLFTGVRYERIELNAAAVKPQDKPQPVSSH